MNLKVYILLILVLPAVGALIGSFRKRLSLADFAPSIFTFVSFILALKVGINNWNNPVQLSFSWFSFKVHGSLSEATFNFGFFIDNVSIILLVLIPFIASLVLLYSISYLKNDPNLQTYWLKLGAFCSVMLALIAVNNLLALYFFWELVGFTSYLLIGFWNKAEAPPKASTKAFLINRVGDMAFLLGIFIIYQQYRTLNFVELIGLIKETSLIANSTIGSGNWLNVIASNGGAFFTSLPEVWLIIAGLCFFLGACAKSAQIPFQNWLPDAMVGPTPVSSLIHAATMVIAGVYLLIRLLPILHPVVLLVIAVIGSITALFAGISATVQKDIKQVLAYSTISQIGFMMVAIGAGSASAAIIHLSTHAFFKCLLFLASGGVILFMRSLQSSNPSLDDQNLNHMGGIAKAKSILFIPFTLAVLAISGIPLFSGFLSKDAILFALNNASSGSSIYLLAMGFSLLAILCTGFYSARLWTLIFIVPAKWKSPKAQLTLSWQILAPIIALCVLCFYFPFGISPFNPESSWIVLNIFQQRFFVNVDMASVGLVSSPVLIGLSLILTAAGLSLGFINAKKAFFPNSIWTSFWLKGFGWDVVLNKIVLTFSSLIWTSLSWFEKNILDLAGIRLITSQKYVAHVAKLVDRYVIDGMVVGSGKTALFGSLLAKKSGSGYIQWYILLMVLSLFAIFTFLI